jgi:hypothetical protein
MSHLLQLADCYYKVASDLEQQARQSLAIAEHLRTHADKLCETNMRQPAKQDPTRADHE